MITLQIPDVPPSLNTLLRMHWGAKSREISRWQRFVWAAKCQVMSVTPPLERKQKKVTIERFSPRLLDKDNLYGAYKMVVDSLKKQDLIYDDSPKYLQLHVEQHKAKVPATRITIEDV